MRSPCLAFLRMLLLSGDCGISVRVQVAGFFLACETMWHLYKKKQLDDDDNIKEKSIMIKNQ